MADHAVAVSKAVAELMEEDEEEPYEDADEGEGSPTAGLAPKQVLAPWVTMPVVLGFWVVGLSDQAARRGPGASSRAWAKAPTIQAELMPPAETDKELVRLNQAQELVAEEARQGRDMAILEVVMEAARMLRCGQLEG